MFNTLLSFIEFLVTKFVSLNDESYIVRPTLINLNIFDLKYYPFMVSLDKCNGSCNVLSPKICVLKKKKKTNVKTLNMMKLKQLQNIFLVIAEANSLVQHVIKIKNRITKHVNVSIKFFVSARKIIVGILAHVFVRMINI